MLSWSCWSSTGILYGFVPENKSVENACDNGWRCDGRGNCITDECRVTKAYWMNASGSEVWSVIPTTRVKMIAETADCDNGEVIIFNVSHKDGYSNFLEPSTLPPYETSGVVSNGRVERSFIGTIAHGAISVYEFEARPASGDVSEAKISPELLVSESECFRNDLKYDCMRCVYSTLEGDWIPEPYRRDHDQCHMCRPVLERSGANIPLVTKSVPIASDILAMCDVFNIIFNDEGTVHGFNKFTSITEYVPVPLSGDPCNQKLDSGGLAYGKCKCGECVEPEACDSSNKCGSTCKDDFTFLRWQCIDGKCVNPVEENRRSKKVFCWQGQEKLLRNKNEPSFLKNYAVGSLPLNLQKISGTIPGTEFIPGGGVGVAFKWAPKGRVPTREESTQAVFSVSAVTYGLNLNLGKIKKEYCDPIVGLFCGGSK